MRGSTASVLTCFHAFSFLLVYLASHLAFLGLPRLQLPCLTHRSLHSLLLPVCFIAALLSPQNFSWSGSMVYSLIYTLSVVQDKNSFRIIIFDSWLQCIRKATSPSPPALVPRPPPGLQQPLGCLPASFLAHHYLSFIGPWDVSF